MVKKVRKFLYALFIRMFWKRRSYKPVGVYASCESYVKSETGKRAWYTEVYSNLVSYLFVDEQFYNSCSAYLKTIARVETTYAVVAIPDGRVHTDNSASVAILSPDNKLIGDVSFNYRRQKVVTPQENTIFLQNYFSRPMHYPGTVFSMLTGGAGLNNYFHWLVDTLPRLHLLNESGLKNSVDRFLIPSYQYPYQQDSLNAFGISQDTIIEGRKHPHVTADILIASTAPRGKHSVIPEWICTFLRNSYLKSTASSLQSSPFIYVSRQDSAIRHVLNEEDLELLLASYGFQTVTLSKRSFSEQVNLFAHAKIVLAPHGAGLINLVFCQKHTSVIELFAQSYVKATYHDLSKKVGLDYYYLLCEGKQASTVKQGMKLDLQVDLRKIKVLLDQLIPQKECLKI